MSLVHTKLWQNSKSLVYDITSNICLPERFNEKQLLCIISCYSVSIFFYKVGR